MIATTLPRQTPQAVKLIPGRGESPAANRTKRPRSQPYDGKEGGAGSGPAPRWRTGSQAPVASRPPREKKGQGPEGFPSKPRPEHNQPKPEPESEDYPVALPHLFLLSGGLTRALARRPHPFSVLRSPYLTAYGPRPPTTQLPWSDPRGSPQSSRLPSRASSGSRRFPP